MPTYAPLQDMSDQEFRKWIQTWWPAVSKISGLGFGLPYLFGDGSDGDVSISSDTNITVWTIKQYKNLSIDAGYTLSSSSTSLILYVQERLNIWGAINLNGKNSSTSNVDPSYAAAGGGGGGGSPTLGSPTSGRNTTIASGGAAGYVGHLDGGGGGDITLMYQTYFRMRSDIRDGYALTSWGARGGTGSGASMSAAGGNGGGCILIFANEVYIGSTGSITANGNVGADGSWTVGPNYCGGGGGGGGGLIWIVTQNYTNDGTISATGGAGGAGYSSAGDGGDGGDGAAIVEIIPS